VTAEASTPTEGGRVNKAELVAAVAESTGMTGTDSKAAVDAVIETITAQVRKGEKISIPGFLVFDVVQRAKRTGRNPATGEEMVFPAKKVVKITAGSKLKEAAAGGK
jgi:DNA-binding protein HU-beta